MRRLLAWTLVVPLALAGSQFAHALAYVLAVPDAGARAALLSATGHGYLGYAPFGAALVTVLCCIGILAHVRMAWSGGRHVRLDARPFAAVPIAVFALQEHFERLVHEGTLSLATALEPTFLLGLALQVPFALLAYAFARLLLRAADVLGHILADARRSTAPRRSPPGRRLPSRILPPRLGVLALGYAGRGPPLTA
jgi:hypothetical protein